MKKPAPTAKTKNVKANFTIRIAPEVREALDKAGKAEDRAAGYITLRFIVERLKAGANGRAPRRKRPERFTAHVEAFAAANEAA